MAKIRKDNKGLYVIINKSVARPNKPTRFSEGDVTMGNFFKDLNLVGLGKLEFRGDYEEYWVVTDEEIL